MRPFLTALTIMLPAALAAQDRAGQSLPTGQRLTPAAAPGARFEPLVSRTGPDPAYVADGAAAIATRPDGREMLVLTSGYNRFNGADGKVVAAQSVQYIFRYAIDARGSRRLQTLTIPNSYGGIAWRPDGRGFVVGGGVDDDVHVFGRSHGGYAEISTIKLSHAAGIGAGVKPQAAGVAVSPDGHRALVANYYNDSVSLIDLDRNMVVAEQDLRPGKIDPARSGVPGGEFPFAIAWTDAGHAWVSSPRDRQVVALSLSRSGIRVADRIATVGEPTALLADARNHRLFATEDNDDRLAVIDTANARLVEEPRLSLPDALAAPGLGKGLNPNGLAQLRDGRLLVTLGGINAVAIVAPGSSGGTVTGLVPTGWYPSAVATSPAGERVFVVNRKSPPGPNPQGCAPKLAIYRGQPNACGAANQYIFQLEKAGLLQFPLPNAKALAATTLQVADNIGLPGAAARAEAEARIAAIRARVSHVVFIVKENRTYDQVLGDLEVGNGDPHLAILGRALSPNHHQLARQFATLDNFYDSGEQSSTGWTWSTAARTPDLLEKTAPVNYAQRGLAYEAEEADRFIYAQQTPAERQATNPALSKDPDLLAGSALLTAPDGDGDDDGDKGQGFLWDQAIRAGLSVRNYGFSDASIYDADAPGAVPVIRQPFKERHPVYTPGDKLLASRSDPYFRGFDQKLADYWRVGEWQREFDAADAAGKVPALTLLRLSHDHFGDFKEAIDGVNTVETEMADNDYALGMVVERIANSHVAGSTLIFVIEDDAQNGADHVDARRSVAFVAGPYVRQHVVVSTRYTTVNMLRTIEAVLGLKPLGLNDGLAAPMADLFDPAQASWSYRAVAADVLHTTQLPIAADRFAPRIAATTGRCDRPTSAWWATAMLGQDFRTEDHLDTAAFNAALWRGLGSGIEPTKRDGRDLRSARSEQLKVADVGCSR
ncbi:MULTISPECIES: bifunctional YncE family protein/alkaline phosphatase family protein [unclassified Sphingomonas]|uniref:YncE family protein n=1 Tax=unclassified Sphingomonas TaxID=196159 RepID=UPI00226A703D|nr:MULTISPECIES: bifunctional YncE family protein/alkaline phosphatase family protein [unclassified Sphingomonas]